MSPANKHILKCMLSHGLVFGFLMFIFDWMRSDVSPFWAYVLLVVFFGLFMGLFNGSWNIHALSQIGITHPTDEDFKKHQKRTVSSFKTPEFLIQSLELLDAENKNKRVISQNAIEITTRYNSWTWGEKVRISWEEKQDGEFLYHISSRPRNPWLATDNARNLKHVIDIEGILRTR